VITHSEEAMAAYFVVEIDVHDAVAFEEYRKRVPAIIAQYGGRYLARGGRTETLEGDWHPTRIVVLEFPSVEQAKKFYESSEYAPLKAQRLQAATSKLLLVEGA
jgi:uncharacterized protein (DUF1330 family)